MLQSMEISPYFTSSELTTTSFELYSALDSLSRCGTAYACIGQDLMPTEERGSIDRSSLPAGTLCGIMVLLTGITSTIAVT